MNISKEAIYEYGEGRYIQGYTEGYKSGIITGHLLTMLGVIVTVVLLEVRKQ